MVQAETGWKVELGSELIRETVVKLRGKAAREVEALAARVRQERRVRWSNWCKEGLKEGAGKLYRWVRNGSAVLAMPDCDPLWRPGAGPAPGHLKRAQEVDEAWWRLWGAGRGFDVSGFDKWRKHYQKLPPFPGLLDGGIR